MSWFQEFKIFALRGNVIDVAVGVIIGVVFNNLVDSLIKDVIMPVSALFFNGVDFSKLSFQLHFPGTLAPPIEVKYGSFFNAVMNFLVVSFVVFVVVKAVSRFRSPNAAKDYLPRSCPECHMSVPSQAKRCGHCCSDIKS